MLEGEVGEDGGSMALRVGAERHQNLATVWAVQVLHTEHCKTTVLLQRRNPRIRV